MTLEIQAEFLAVTGCFGHRAYREAEQLRDTARPSPLRWQGPSAGLQPVVPRFVVKWWFCPQSHGVFAFPSLIHSTFGELKTVRLPKKMAGTGSHRGFGFVDFLTKQDAKVRSCPPSLAPSQPGLGAEGGEGSLEAVSHWGLAQFWGQLLPFPQ